MDWSKTYRPEKRVTVEDVAEHIRDTVKMIHVIDLYYPELRPRHNRIPCPLHDGKDYNFSFGDSWYKCFVCGGAGDVISFVKETQHLATRYDAMKRLNQDLGLHLPLGGDVDAGFSAEAERKRKLAQEQERIAREWEEEYHRLLDEWIKADKTIHTAEPMSDEWISAKKRIDYISFLLDEHMDRKLEKS